MTKKNLYLLWGAYFILCAGLGFIPQPEGIWYYVLTAVSIGFFLPPVFLLVRGGREDAKLIRNLSALSLGLTLLLLVVNFLCAFGSEFWGTVLHFVLAVVSTPMIPCGAWALSLFLWACLLMAAMKKLGRKS